jgi:hypothetical protein
VFILPERERARKVRGMGAETPGPAWGSGALACSPSWGRIGGEYQARHTNNAEASIWFQTRERPGNGRRPGRKADALA